MHLLKSQGNCLRSLQALRVRPTFDSQQSRTPLNSCLVFSLTEIFPIMFQLNRSHHKSGNIVHKGHFDIVVFNHFIIVFQPGHSDGQGTFNSSLKHNRSPSKGANVFYLLQKLRRLWQEESSYVSTSLGCNSVAWKPHWDKSMLVVFCTLH